MADELVKLTDGTNTVDFLSGQGATTGYVKRNIQGLDTPPCEVKFSAGRPLQRKWQNREPTITFGIMASDAADLVNKKTAIIEILENTYLYWTSKGKLGAKAQFQYRRPGGTNISYADVYWGECDWGVVEHQQGAPYAYALEGAQLTLTCETGFHPINVVVVGQNLLGTPHFEEDGDSDGLADQWTLIGTPTYSLNTTYYLCGTRSQKIITDDATAEGIFQSMVVSSETSAIGYVWIHVDSGDEVAVELYDYTAGQVRDLALYSTAGWQTKVGAGGKTWKRLIVSSSSLVANNAHFLRILRRLADATEVTLFYVDQCYFEFGTTTLPDAWGSCENVFNVRSATTWGRINYRDVTDIDGDLDAPCNIKIEPAEEFTGVDIDKFWIAIVGPMHNIKHWGEIDMSYDATRSNDSVYMTTTLTGSGWVTPGKAYVMSLTAAQWKAMAGRTWRVLAGMYANLTSLQWRSKVMLRGWPSTVDGIVIDTTKGVNHPEAAQFCVVNLGPIYITQKMAGDYSGDTLYIGWEYNPNGVATNIAVDFLCLVPEHRYSAMIDKSPTIFANYLYRTTTDALYLRSITGSYGSPDFPHHVFTESYTGPENIGCMGTHIKGTYPKLVPGEDNRIIFLFAESGDRHNITRKFKVTVEYLPQYLIPLA